MKERLQSIRPRLEELARLDPDFNLFGSKAHQYQLAPPLGEATVREFETHWNIVLPEDYRAFVLEVGSRGAGPYYGLKSLGDFEHAAELSGVASDFLASPFPHRVHFNLEPPAVKDLDEEEAGAHWKAWEEEVFQDKWVLGTLCLCHEGCGMFDILVVSGEKRGSIWGDYRCNDYGIAPVAIDLNFYQREIPFSPVDSAHTSFLDWYETWLDWSLNQAKSATTN